MSIPRGILVVYSCICLLYLACLILHVIFGGKMDVFVLKVVSRMRQKGN